MRQSFIDKYAKVISGVLLVLLLLEANHSKNQSQVIAELNASLGSAIEQIDELTAQVTNLESSNKDLLTEIKVLQTENDRLETAVSLNALKPFTQGQESFGSTGATGRCNDGTETFAANRQGACSWHGGVDYWY